MKLKKGYKYIFLLIPLLIVTGFDSFDYATEPQTRQTEIIVPYVENEWWLIKWSDYNNVCRIYIDHEGVPNSDEIVVYCGESAFQEWLKTKPCEPAIKGLETSSCSGLYLHKVASEASEKTILVELPLPTAWISIIDCDLSQTINRCKELPNILITGEEPLPNESIIRVEGTYNEIPFLCEASECLLPIRPTSKDGIEIEFWVDSSFGDTSEHFKAQIRVTDGGVSSGPDSGGWIIDYIGDHWLQGEATQGCKEIWGAFEPINGLPIWLDSPDWAVLLSTDEPLMFLAGRLIERGIVYADECTGGGLQENGYSSQCGLEKARVEVEEWQNQFDDQIVEVSQSTGIPAQLMKNLFALESQFWPGAYRDSDEYGFGQLTEIGADTILLWNRTFFNQFCPLVLSDETCDLGYPQIQEDDQEILRSALAITASSNCPDCPASIDLEHADNSIELFAQTILANCKQVGQIITNVSGKSPGQVASYVDLWKFTLANYHAGPGCLSNAISNTTGNIITWEDIIDDLEADCPGTQQYVGEIVK